MLWFDNKRGRTLSEKIAGAAAYYQRKFGIAATVCYLHPSMLLSESAAIDGLALRESNAVLPHHFWLGIDDKSPRSGQETGCVSTEPEETTRHP